MSLPKSKETMEIAPSYEIKIMDQSNLAHIFVDGEDMFDDIGNFTSRSAAERMIRSLEEEFKAR